MEAADRALSPRKPAPPLRLWLLAAVAFVTVLAVAAGVWALRADDGNGTVGDAGASTLTNAGGGVTLAATWNGDRSSPAFSITLDTHTVDLDGYDLSRLAALRVDGSEVAPMSWDAPKGGHHREGRLVFPATTADGRPLIDASTTEIVLVVRGIAGVEERVLTWNP